MVSCFVSLWMAAALGQAPAGEAAWLKSVPADVAAVVRVKALETARDDLMKMLEAMSGNAAALAKGPIDQGMEQFTAMHGKPAAQHPFFTVMRLPKDGAPIPPWAVLVESDNYTGVLKGIARKDDLTPKPTGQGYDTFDGPDGTPWFSFKGTGFVAFGQDEALIKAISKPQASLSEKISTELRTQLLGGDLGLYVNVAAIQAQYAEQIEGGKQMFMGLLDQAGDQMGPMKDSIKSMYGSMFDSLKVADALALNFDFAGEGLTVSGLATVKADSSVAKSLASARTGTGADLGKLPAESTAFVYMNVNPENLAGIQRFGMSFMTGETTPSPEMEKALALQREAGATETYSGNSGKGVASGMDSFSISKPKDPEKAIEAQTQIARAMKSGKGMVKDVTVTDKALSYKGYTFNMIKTTFDLEKMVAPGAPGGVEGVRKMFGGDTITAYYGTDGKTVLTVTARTPEEAKKLIDQATSGEGSIGQSKAFEALRAKFPKEVTTIFFLSAQGLIKQMANQLSATLNKEDLKVPADLPKEPALLGGSLTASGKGFSFEFVVPSSVGPVIEKGAVPIIQSLQGQIQ